jgi:lysophospholipase L1-like esterase
VLAGRTHLQVLLGERVDWLMSGEFYDEDGHSKSFKFFAPSRKLRRLSTSRPGASGSCVWPPLVFSTMASPLLCLPRAGLCCQRTSAWQGGLMIRRVALPFLLTLWTGAAAAQESPIAVYLAGDSTLAMKLESKRPETGWGEKLQAFFDAREVRVDNRAVNGRSTRTFLSEGRWDAILGDLRPGDYVVIEFGHNDESPSKADRFTTPEQFRANLERFVADVRERQATPLLFTPIARRRFDAAGHAQQTHAEYSPIVRSVAQQTGAALIDLDAASTALLDSLGDAASKSLFLILEPGVSPNYPHGVNDNTHLSPAGAQAIAQLAVDGLRMQKVGLADRLQGE